MSLVGLLERGVMSVLAEPEAEEELRELLVARAADAAAAEHVRQTIEVMPGLLVSIRRALDEPDAPSHARELFAVVLGYVLDDDNLIPSHAGKPLLGLLDDVYMVHLAAMELAEHLGRVDMRSVAGGAALLEQVLPRDVIGQLKQRVEDARVAARRRRAR